MAKTTGKKAGVTRKRRKAAKKAAVTRRRSASGRKAAQTKTRRAAGRKAATTKRRRAAGRQAAATKKRNTQAGPVSEEMVLGVAADGGGLTIAVAARGTSAERFVVRRDESAMADLLGEDEFTPAELRSAWSDLPSLDAALAVLDTYPWHNMTPLVVHPEYEMTISASVSARGGEQALGRWQRSLEAHRPR